jgi:hypothetical protein
MPSPPRTREFYRPLLEDLHEAARNCRNGLSGLGFSETLLIAVILLAGPVLVFSLVQCAASRKPEVPVLPQPVRPAVSPSPAPAEIPATVPADESLVSSFVERGATFGPRVYGRVTFVTLHGEQFTDDDMPQLSTLVTLESVTLIDAGITDEGLRALRLPRLRELVLINTRVTEEAAEAYPETNGPPNVRVRLIRDFGED